LGSKIVANGSFKEGITERKNTGKFYQLVRGTLSKWKMPEKGRMCLFKSYYMPILTYGPESQTCSKVNISRLMTTEMIF
jgi:hypothetical protein